MITREQFKNLIEAIQKEHKRIEEWEEFLGNHTDSYVILKRTLIDDIIDFLEDYFCQGNDYISWWLFEDVEKHIWENGMENPPTDVSNIDDLYDFLVREKEYLENETNI